MFSAENPNKGEKLIVTPEEASAKPYNGPLYGAEQPEYHSPMIHIADMEALRKEYEDLANNPEVRERLTDASEAGREAVAIGEVSSELKAARPELAAEIDARQAELERNAARAERALEIEKLKAEISELNTVTQKSEVLEKFGAEHSFNKDETYSFIEARVLENERKIRELEGSAQAPAQAEAPANLPAEEPVVNEAATQVPEQIPAIPQAEVPQTPERVMNRPLTQAEKDHFFTSFENYGNKGERKNWWGFIKERVKGLASVGWWESHQAEKFRSNKKQEAEAIASQTGAIWRTENLSLDDALLEAEGIRMMARNRNIETLTRDNYQEFSDSLTAGKIEQNNDYINSIIAHSSASLRERLATYRNEFGKVVVDDQKIMTDFETGLRTSLTEVQYNHASGEAKQFNKLITQHLDPGYWRRYVYTGIEAALWGLGIKWAGTALLNSKWWLGKKAAEAGADIVLPSPETIAPLPGSGDMPMHNTIWQTAKEYLVDNGITNPSNEEIMNVSKEVATESHIGVKEWGIPGDPMDTNMDQGHLLKFGGASKILMAIKVARGISSVI